jgi:hypothetical protein
MGLKTQYDPVQTKALAGDGQEAPAAAGLHSAS